MQEASGPQINTLTTKEHPDLYHKSIRGGYWSVFLQAVINLLSFGKVLIIANFFYLEDLGIISIALMMMEVLSTFTETGFDAALVQKKEDIQSYLNTAWTAGLVKGFILFIILYCAAPFLASIRVSPDKVDLTISIIRAMSVCFVIKGARNIGTIYFQKELDFRKVFILTFTTTLADIVLSVAFIYIFRSIWGVIAARIIAAVVNSIGSYILSPYRPRFHFEYAKAIRLWQFGKWIYGSNSIGYLISQGDNYFVWSYLGVPQLALYKYALNFATTPSTHISQVISTVSYPACCKIQDDLPRLREAYLKILKITILFSTPISFLIFYLGPDFVKLFLKEHLHPMILAMQILTLKGLLGATGSVRVSLYKAIGKPKLDWYLQWIRLIILVIAIFPLTATWGIVGTAVAKCLVSLMVNPFGFLMAHKLLKCSLKEHLMPSVYPLIASCVMIGSITIVKYLTFMNEYILFAASVIAGSAIYLVSLLFLDYCINCNYREIIMEQIHLIRKKVGLQKGFKCDNFA